MASGGGATPSSALESATSSSSRKLSDRRLFVSNLAPHLTEHDLLLLFQPHGTLSKLDLIFHRSGPEKGKPKGYAFVELAHKDEAERARKAVEGRLVKGREVRVSYATAMEDLGVGPHRRKRIEDPTKPTMLSLVKNLKRNDSTDARIAAMEAKLNALKRKTEPQSTDIGTKSTPSSSVSLDALPSRHPSLPAKPSR